jgi:hypothetical protein
MRKHSEGDSPREEGSGSDAMTERVRTGCSGSDRLVKRIIVGRSGDVPFRGDYLSEKGWCG